MAGIYIYIHGYIKDALNAYITYISCVDANAAVLVVNGGIFFEHLGEGDGV